MLFGAAIERSRFNEAAINRSRKDAVLALRWHFRVEASMRPRSTDRGKDAKPAGSTGSPKASMRPRSTDRGKEEAERRPKAERAPGFNEAAINRSRKARRLLGVWFLILTASMRPRSTDRGKQRRLDLPLAGQPEASMRPRSTDRGKSSIVNQILNFPGFNEAAINRSRKVHAPIGFFQRNVLQ